MKRRQYCTTPQHGNAVTLKFKTSKNVRLNTLYTHVESIYLSVWKGLGKNLEKFEALEEFQA